MIKKDLFDENGKCNVGPFIAEDFEFSDEVIEYTEKQNRMLEEITIIPKEILRMEFTI